MAVGGVLVGVSWFTNSVATSQAVFATAAMVGGPGGGIVYGTAVGNALKWFLDRRGLAAGLTAAGYGAGSALTVVPIVKMIQGSGYRATLASSASRKASWSSPHGTWSGSRSPAVAGASE